MIRLTVRGVGDSQAAGDSRTGRLGLSLLAGRAVGHATRSRHPASPTVTSLQWYPPFGRKADSNSRTLFFRAAGPSRRKKAAARRPGGPAGGRGGGGELARRQR